MKILACNSQLSPRRDEERILNQCKEEKKEQSKRWEKTTATPNPDFIFPSLSSVFFVGVTFSNFPFQRFSLLLLALLIKITPNSAPPLSLPPHGTVICCCRWCFSSPFLYFFSIAVRQSRRGKMIKKLFFAIRHQWRTTFSSSLEVSLCNFSLN